MDVSIIIPTYNSESTLEDCLWSIIKNKTVKSYEILVCDAGSSDRTLEIAKRYADNVLMGKPKMINRNIGIENAKGRIILFTDSDCLVPIDWIDKLSDGLVKCSQTHYRAFGVGGGNVAWLDNPNPVELAISKVMISPLVAFKARNTANYEKDREVEHNPPINSAYFKWILDKYDGFVEQDNYPEDLDLDTRLIEKGYHLYYLSGIVVKHKHKTSYSSFAKQMYNFGVKRIAINKKHRLIRHWYHKVPAMLCIMLCSPLFFVPCGLAVLNALHMRDWRVFYLTILFYYSYGKGELNAMLGASN
jgi:glycosyltransferase involved in cell wall biosynthesis